MVEHDKEIEKSRKEFWELRAGLGYEAGTKDIILKELEIESLCKYISDGKKILDIGCGNGITCIEIAKMFDVDICGFDYSEKMITEANKLIEKDKQYLKGSLYFNVFDLLNLHKIDEFYDIIITERALINLNNWDSQKKSINAIINLLRKDGLFLMCESSIKGLENINSYRKKCSLSKVEPPWHNCYFDDNLVNTLNLNSAHLDKVDCFSSTYYFLSRIVNAYVADCESKEPKYNSPINQIACLVPNICDDFAQTKIWIWRKY